MSANTISKPVQSTEPCRRKESLEEGSEFLSTGSLEQQSTPSTTTVNSPQIYASLWRSEEKTIEKEAQDFLIEGDDEEERDSSTEKKILGSQSSVYTDLTLESLILSQNTVHHSHAFGSQSVARDNVNTSDTLTFPQSVKKVWDNFTDKNRLPTSRAITNLLPITSNVSMARPTAISTEITEARSPDDEISSTEGSEISITSKVPAPAANAPSTTTAQSENPRKRRRFWQNLRRRGSGGGGGKVCFPKRLCSCLSPKSRKQEEEAQYPVYEITNIEYENGIIRSNIAMDSETTRQIEQVVDENGGFIVLSGTKLEAYQAKLTAMMNSAFDTSVGSSVLETWRLEPPPQFLEISAGVEEVESYKDRPLSLADVDLTQIRRTSRNEDRDHILFRYFKSYQGLTTKMLIP